MYRELKCYLCGQPLSGGLDTYGEPGQEHCQACDIALADYYEYDLMRHHFRTNVGRTLREVTEEYRWIDTR